MRYLNSGSFSTAAAASGPRDGELLCSRPDRGYQLTNVACEEVRRKLFSLPSTSRPPGEDQAISAITITSSQSDHAM